jgi:hypothetical protein
LASRVGREDFVEFKSVMQMNAPLVLETHDMNVGNIRNDIVYFTVRLIVISARSQRTMWMKNIPLRNRRKNERHVQEASDG